MNKNIIVAFTSGSIGILCAYLGYDVTSWQLWVFLILNIISLTA